MFRDFWKNIVEVFKQTIGVLWMLVAGYLEMCFVILLGGVIFAVPGALFTVVTGDVEHVKGLFILGLIFGLFAVPVWAHVSDSRREKVHQEPVDKKHGLGPKRTGGSAE
jgi:hypothetical protein